MPLSLGVAARCFSPEVGRMDLVQMQEDEYPPGTFSSHLKHRDWGMSFLLGRPPERCYTREVASNKGVFIWGYWGREAFWRNSTAADEGKQFFSGNSDETRWTDPCCGFCVFFALRGHARKIYRWSPRKTIHLDKKVSCSKGVSFNLLINPNFFHLW